MRSRLASLAVAGVVGLTGVAGAALIAPAVSYAATGDSTALEDRVASLRQALTGLVSDGTLTQAQADQVASALAEHGPRGHGGRGGFGLTGVLEDLGITAEEVRAAAQAGTTLAELAEANGVSSQRLVDALVAATQERLDDAVADGRLTQAEADERAAEVESRITQSLDEPVRLGRGHRGGHGGGGGGGHHSSGAGEGADPSTGPSTAPSQSDDA